MATAKNSTAISFPTPSGDWGRPNRVIFYSAISSGTALVTCNISPALTADIGSGAIVNIPANGIVITQTATGNLHARGAAISLRGLVGLDGDSSRTDGNPSTPDTQNSGTWMYAALVNSSGLEPSGNNYSRVSVRNWVVAE